VQKERTIISLQQVTFTYDGAHQPALQDVMLCVRSGERVCVVGSSGSGKTTLLHLIAGFAQLQESGKMTGECIVTPPKTSADSCGIGIVVQQPEDGFIGVYVEDELAFGPENLRVPPNVIHRRIDAALREVGLPDERHARTANLSGGQQQRVAIASILTMEPEVLLFDDATSSLDAAAKSHWQETAANLHKAGRTIVETCTRLTTSFVEALDRLIVLESGRVIADGPADVIAKQYRDQLSAMGCLRESGVLIDVTTKKSLYNNGNASQATLLETRQLSFSYKDRHLFNDINIKVGPGNFVVVKGPNGTGKTTFGKLLATILLPTDGVVLSRGENLHRLPPRELARRIGYVNQQADRFFMTDSVFSELLLGLQAQSGMYMQGTPTPAMKEQGERLLQQAGLAAHITDHPHRLSRSHKQTLAFLMTAIAEPDVIILDEPTAGLDYREADRFARRCAAYADRGKAIVMITHDVELFASYATNSIYFT